MRLDAAAGRDAHARAMAAAAGGVPVSLKCRVGTHDRLAGDAAPPVDAYGPLAEFVHAVSRSGAVQRCALLTLTLT